MKNIKAIIFIFGFFLLSVNILSAQEAVILYTGQTHAMLYPCSCPIQQDGGIARRATLVNALRKKYPGLLLLDCGAFTSGGLMDEYTQNTQLDTQRSDVNFQAMELMRYDAVGISSDEFNFGKGYFLKHARKDRPAFLSANLESDKVSPYIIKEVNGVKIGIIGLTGLAANGKSEGLKIKEPAAIEQLVSAIRKQGVEVVVILSTLGEKEDLKLVSQVKGIDIIFVGDRPLKDESLTKTEAAFILRPVWQGRKLGKLILEVKNGKLINCKIEDVRLSDKIADDPAVAAILPRCYSDANCKKDGLMGSCNDPGELKANCMFVKPNKISLRVISAKDCTVCNTDRVLVPLKKKFPGLSVEYIYLSDPRANKMIKDFVIQALPAYILGREVEKESNFESIKSVLDQKGNFYLLKPQASGISYLLGRQKEKGRLDVFFSLFEKETNQFLAQIKEFAPQLHFLAIEKGNSFDAKDGPFETEEYLRGVCVQKYYPAKFWDYLDCRSKNANSSWWEDCLSGVELSKIKTCARGPEGAKLLKENIALGENLQIMFGPVYLLNNYEIFSSSGVIDKEELRKIIKK